MLWKGDLVRFAGCNTLRHISSQEIGREWSRLPDQQANGFKGWDGGTQASYNFKVVIRLQQHSTAVTFGGNQRFKYVCRHTKSNVGCSSVSSHVDALRLEIVFNMAIETEHSFEYGHWIATRMTAPITSWSTQENLLPIDRNPAREQADDDSSHDYITTRQLADPWSEEHACMHLVDRYQSRQKRSSGLLVVLHERRNL